MPEQFPDEDSSESLNTNEELRALGRYFKSLLLASAIPFIVAGCEDKTKKQEVATPPPAEKATALNTDLLSPPKIEAKKYQMSPVANEAFYSLAEKSESPEVKNFFKNFPRQSEYFRVEYAEVEVGAKTVVLYIMAEHVLPTSILPPEMRTSEIVLENLEEVASVNRGYLKVVEEIVKKVEKKPDGIFMESLTFEDETLVNGLVKTKPNIVVHNYLRNLLNIVYGQNITPEILAKHQQASNLGNQLAREYSSGIFATSSKALENEAYKTYLTANEAELKAKKEVMQKLDEKREDEAILSIGRNTEPNFKFYIMPYGGSHDFQKNVKEYNKQYPKASISFIAISSHEFKENIKKYLEKQK